MRLSALTASLGPLQWLFSTGTPPQATRNQLHFELRHQYALSNSTSVIFTDIPKISSGDVAQTSYSVRTREITSYKQSYFVPYSRRPSRSLRLDQSENGDWDEVEILGPDVESREVLLELAKMTHNAYLEVDDSRWYDLGENWTSVSH
jgi:lipase ATG15